MIAEDDTNSQPFLEDVPSQSIEPGQEYTVRLVGTDVEGDALTYDAHLDGATGHGSSAGTDFAFAFDEAAGVATFTIPDSFTRPAFIEAGVRGENSNTQGLPPRDSQRVAICPARRLGGDLDNDNRVAFRDFLILADNFGQQNAAPEQGDLNGDGGVTFSDFLIMQQNFGRSSEARLVAVPDLQCPDESNTTPLAVEDIYATNANTILDVDRSWGLLANDSDVDWDRLDLQLIGNTRHGQLVLGDHGAFTYTPPDDFTGLDSFTYNLSDGISVSKTVVVDIAVLPALQRAQNQLET